MRLEILILLNNMKCTITRIMYIYLIIEFIIDDINTLSQKIVLKTVL